MAQPFSFGFGGDDIEEDPNDVSQPSENGAGAEDSGPAPIPAKTHDLDELLSAIPDKLSYTLTSTTSPSGKTARLPRRELFDVRLQIMAEDDLPDTSSTSSTNATNALSGLDESDISTNIYEGGYKTWECSIDLVSYLLDRGPRKDLDDLVRVNHVIEMGCGTALPSLLLFQYALRNKLVGMYFTLTDYNAEVLRLVTLPNLLLTYVSTLPATAAPFSEDEPNPLATPEPGNNGKSKLQFASGELYVTPQLIQGFKTALRDLGITLTLLSGSWVPTENLLNLIPSTRELNTFVLASETIYSPAALESFTEAMVALLGRVHQGKAIVAAKRVYFGVGGSVDGFREECSRRGCVAVEMEFEGLETRGVRRCLVEVQMY